MTALAFIVSIVIGVIAGLYSCRAWRQDTAAPTPHSPEQGEA